MMPVRFSPGAACLALAASLAHPGCGEATGQGRSSAAAPEVASRPEPTAGQVDAANAAPGPPRRADLPAGPAPPWQLVEWANSAPLTLAALRGRVVVVRFWTDRCRFCAATMPALQRLAAEFRDRPVTFVGAYHSKPFGSERPWSVATRRAREMGITFPIAYDRRWKTVQSWWLAGRPARATSATFVIGGDGRFVHIHPGPVFFPSRDPADARANADFHAVRDAIARALERLPERRRPRGHDG